jgi:hypothetical protein
MESIKSYIDTVHNLNLVDPYESPNGNTIYHIYCDGEITYQKGGLAYLQRSEFSSSCVSLKKNYYDLFPVKVSGNRISYAVVTQDDARKIQEMMIEFDRN